MPPKITAFHSQVNVQRQVKIPMRDRINLTADIYRPKKVDSTLPVLLMRLPYGRAIASTCTYVHPSWYASQGYIVVIQDVRGCGTSEGEFYPFRNEYDDGFDTVEWCVKELEGSSGKVGMYGFSYQGVTQFQAAVQQPEGLITICPTMATADLYHGWFYFGGALCLDFDLGWALQLAQNRAWYLKQEPQATNLFDAQKQMSKWLGATPLSEIELFKNESFGDFGKFFFDWIGNQQADDEYWQKLNPLSYFDRYDLPALHIAGWADIFIEATINTYHQAKSATTKPQLLVVAPWQHMPWLPKVGEIDFGEAAVSKIDQLQVDWFDFWLKGIENGICDRAPVQMFLMGKNHWLDLPEFPKDTHTKIFYLSSQKQLSDELRITLVSMGVLRAKFRKSWTEPEWIESDVVNEYRIKLRPTCQNFAQGHRIGVAIASSAFPAIDRHSNTQKLPSEATVSDLVEATQQIFYGAEYPSYLQLPIK